VGAAAAAGAAAHPEAAADPEAATDQRVPEAAREPDPAAPGPTPGAPQGQHSACPSGVQTFCAQGTPRQNLKVHQYSYLCKIASVSLCYHSEHSENIYFV